MKTLSTLIAILAGATLAATPLRADEPAKEMKCSEKKEGEAKKPGMEKMQKEVKAMENEEKAATAELDKLFNAMNSSVGEEKTEAMAAILNKMDKKNAAAGEAGYYTCKMHPAVRWPVPGKCPICSMDLVPLAKTPADAPPAGEPKKADDPHAAHH